MTVSKYQLDNMLSKNKAVLTLNARYDRKKASIVLANKELIIKHLERDSTSRSKSKEGDHLWNMIEWQSKYGKIDGSNVKYDMAKDASFGRLYPIKSVHGYVQVTRSVRHYLAKDIYTDIDIDNCHPVLIEQLFPLIVHRESVSVKYWNRNRKELFSRMQAENPTLSRDQCKEVGFIFLYGGNMEKEFKKLGLTTNIDPNSVWSLCKQLSKDMEIFTQRFSDVYRDVFDSLGSLRNASKLSIVMQHIERHLAIILVKVATGMGLEVGDICHDGIFISRNGSPVDESEINEFIERACSQIKVDTGFTVNLSVKGMSNPVWVNELKVNVDVEDDVETDDDYIIRSDDEGVTKFMKKFHNRLYYSADGWYIRPIDSYFWLAGDHSVKAQIMKCNYWMKKTKAVVYSANSAGCNAIFSALCNRKEELIDTFTLGDTLVNKVNESIVGYVHWEDKHYHAVTQKFYDNDCNSGFGAFIHINGKAPVEEFESLTEDDEIYQLMNNRFFSMLDKQQRTDLFRCLSRGMFGYITDKVWLILDSGRDGGKSSITKAAEKAFGAYVENGVRPPTAAMHSNDSSKNAWILSRQLHKRRIAWSQEEATSLSANGNANVVPFDGNLIKKIASGGDPIDVRALYGAEVKVKYNCLMIVNVNGIPPVTPVDALKTAIPFTIMKEYTTDPEKLAAGGIYAPADSGAVDLMNDPKFIVRLQWAILKLNFVNSRACIASLPSTQQDYFDVTDAVVSPEFKLFKERIIVQDGYIIPSDEVMDLFVSYGLTWSKNRIFKFLKSQIKSLESGNKSVGKKSVHCYTGLQIRTVESDVVSRSEAFGEI